MGVLFEEVNFDSILKDLEKTCLTCEGCEGTNCLVGYAKVIATGCVKNNVTYAEDGMDNIPHDMKLFHEEVLMDAITNILHQCKSCKEEHFDNCIINVIRSCYEVAIFGDSIAYKGSILHYLEDVSNMYPEYAKQLMEQYQLKSKKEN